MDFGLSPDQVLLKQAIRRWLETECPTARVRAIMESESGHDPRLWEGLAELGVPGLQVPAAHGGAGLELLGLALAAEELGWCCTPGPFPACALATAAPPAGGDRSRARRGPRAPRRRRLGRRAPLPRHDGQVRLDARAVRPADRRLPGRQAPARRPRGRPGAGALAVVARRARLRPHPGARR